MVYHLQCCSCADQNCAVCAMVMASMTVDALHDIVEYCSCHVVRVLYDGDDLSVVVDANPPMVRVERIGVLGKLEGTTNASHSSKERVI